MAYGPTQDDVTLDALAALYDTDDVLEAVADALAVANAAETLSEAECGEAIAAAVVVDAALHGAPQPAPDARFADWFAGMPERDSLCKYATDARAAIESVLSERSELNELRAEDVANYPAWSRALLQLRERLQASENNVR